MQVRSHAKSGRQTALSNRTAGAPQARPSQRFSRVQQKRNPWEWWRKQSRFLSSNLPLPGLPPGMASCSPWGSRPWPWCGRGTWTRTSRPSWTAGARAGGSRSWTAPPGTQGRKERGQSEPAGTSFYTCSDHTIHSPIRNTDAHQQHVCWHTLLVWFKSCTQSNCAKQKLLVTNHTSVINPFHPESGSRSHHWILMWGFFSARRQLSANSPSTRIWRPQQSKQIKQIKHLISDRHIATPNISTPIS